MSICFRRGFVLGFGALLLLSHPFETSGLVLDELRERWHR